MRTGTTAARSHSHLDLKDVWKAVLIVQPFAQPNQLAAFGVVQPYFIQVELFRLTVRGVFVFQPEVHHLVPVTMMRPSVVCWCRTAKPMPRNFFLLTSAA